MLAKLEETGKYVWQIGMYLLIPIFLVPIGIRLYYLNCGLIDADESWVAVLWRDLPNTIDGQYVLLFQGLFHNNIFALRLFGFILTIVAQWVLACGFYAYQVNHFDKHWPLWFWIVCASGTGWVAYSTMFYVTINSFVGCFAIGFCLLGMEKRWNWAILLSGFFATSLFANMFTNIVLLPFLLLYLVWYASNRKTALLWFCGGGLLFLLYFSLFIHTPWEYVRMVVAKSQEVIANGANQYGLKFMFSWTKAAIVLNIGFLLIAAGAWGVWHWLRNAQMRKIFQYAWLLAFVVSFLLFLRKSDLYSFSATWWLLAFYLVIDRKIDQTTALVALCVFATYALALGTNVPYASRGLGYGIFMSICVFLMMREKKWVCAVYFYFVLLGVYYFCYKIDKPHFGDIVVTECTKDVRDLNLDQNLKIMPEQFAKAERLQQYVHQGDIAMVDSRNWWAIYLLQLQPTDYSYFLDLADVVQVVGNEQYMGGGKIYYIKG